jgi:pimeloyl-ACP methyl ester carboxylesterase
MICSRYFKQKRSGPMKIISTILILTCTASVVAIRADGQAVGTRDTSASKTREALVYARASDGIVNGGGIFSPQGASAKRVAVLWIHGNGVNFYYPSYVNAARALAARGLTTIVGNTRMHDLGNIEAFTASGSIRGGSYWGVTTEQVRDLAAWIQLAQDRGFDRIVLVGHSAGATAVQIYTARTGDPRVAGLVLASGRFRPAPGPIVDSARLERAKQLVADGHGDEPVPRTEPAARPSPTSAATLVDLASMGVELTDFYGVETPNPPVARVRIPILAWFGTEGDVGTAADLALLEKAMERLPDGPRRVTTAMIPQATHMFDGQESRVATVLADWIDEVVLGAGKGGSRRAPVKR